MKTLLILAFATIVCVTLQPSLAILTAGLLDTWHRRNPLPHGNGTFVAAGAKGVICTSRDAVAWSARSLGSVDAFLGLAYEDGIFIATSATLSPGARGVAEARRGVGTQNSRPSRPGANL